MVHFPLYFLLPIFSILQFLFLLIIIPLQLISKWMNRMMKWVNSFFIYILNISIRYFHHQNRQLFRMVHIIYTIRMEEKSLIHTVFPFLIISHIYSLFSLGSTTSSQYLTIPFYPFASSSFPSSDPSSFTAPVIPSSNLFDRKLFIYYSLYTYIPNVFSKSTAVLRFFILHSGLQFISPSFNYSLSGSHLPLL